MTPELESAYEQEAAAINATRIPRACLLFVVAVAGTGLIELLYRPQVVGLWVRYFIPQVLCVSLPIVFRGPLLRRNAFERTVLISWIAVVLLMQLFGLAAPLATTVIGSAVICIVTGASLLAWWATTSQAYLVLASSLAFSALVVFRGEGGIETTLTLLLVFAGGLISIQGNRYFEIHRRAILREALRSDDEASINRSLEAFAKDLNRGLSDEGVEDHISRLTRVAMGSQWVLLLQRRGAGGALQIVGGDGRLPSSLDNLKALDLSIRDLPFLADSVDDDVRVVESWNSQASRAIRHDRKNEVLLAPLCHHDEQIALLLVGFKELSEGDPRLLRGIAQHAGIAIANSRLMDELRRASTMKSEFLATMSHELRTPLHVIMGYTEMLGDFLDQNGDPEVLQILRRLEQNEKSLTDLIEGTLDAHRLEAGRTVVKQMKFESKTLLEQVRLDTRWLPRTPGVQLKWELPTESVPMLNDPTKLKVIAKNLIGNALKFTKRGAVRVSVQLDRNCGRMALVVSDSGPGIPAQEIPHIFDMFRQATPTASESTLAGVGLGLFIVREFVSQLGGTIAVDNEPQGGARFSVELPLDIAQQQPDANRLVA